MYNEKLSNQWIKWVELDNPEGTRQKEIFPFIKMWLWENNFKNIADIGCWQWNISKLISKEISYYGIEPSTTLLKQANRKNPETHKKFLQANAYETTLKSDSMDSIVSIWVWSHIENLQKATQEMARILESNWRFLIVTAHPETYDIRKWFYSKYKVEWKLLTWNFDLWSDLELSDTTLWLHSQEEMMDAIFWAWLEIDFIGKMWINPDNLKWLYIVLEWHKI